MAGQLPFDPIAEARRQWKANGLPAADEMAAATSIMRAQQLVLAAVEEALKPFELTFARYEVLMLLTFSREGALPLGKIGDRLMVHPTSITNSVDRLESQGLVVRQPHPADRRTVLAQITDEGRSTAEAATDEVVKTKFGLGKVSARDVNAVVTALTSMRSAHGDFDAEV